MCQNKNRKMRNKFNSKNMWRPLWIYDDAAIYDYKAEKINEFNQTGKICFILFIF